LPRIFAKPIVLMVRTAEMRRFSRLNCVTIFLLWSAAAQGAPYRPQDPATVLERLPTSLRGQRAVVRAMAGPAPANLAQAVARTDALIALGRRDADPRFYGYAEATIRPWATLPQPPAEILLRAAMIAQFRHDFDRALDLLAKARAQGYDHPQVDLLTASILRLRGDYNGAMRACLSLMSQPNQLPALVCATEIQSLGGDAGAARAGLERGLAIEQARKVGDLAAPSVLAWARLVLAGMAERAGDHDAARADYARALAEQGGGEVYALGAYADFLLDQQRPAEVLSLLAGREAADGLLLRLTLAQAQMGHADGKPLQARFDALRARGEVPHLGELARFELAINHRPNVAFAHAIANFRKMRDPRDALTLAQCALAVGTKAAAREALQLLGGVDMADLRLAKLRQGLMANAKGA
jgi:hypothetical protein